MKKVYTHKITTEIYICHLFKGKILALSKSNLSDKPNKIDIAYKWTYITNDNWSLKTSHNTQMQSAENSVY